MNDELLQYYNRELAFIRKMGAEFAEAHPKIAGRLRLSADTVEDPHVSRMIEAFALLTARTRHKIDDDFPEVTEALLSILQPHYLRPIPSMAVTQFEFGNEHASLLAGYTIERGTEVLTEPIDGEPCRFRTAYSTKVWPIRVTEARLQGPPFTVPANPFSSRSAAVLQVSLECLAPDATFAKVPLEQLRFFLQGQQQYVYDLYELLFRDTLGVIVAGSPSDRAVTLPQDCLQPVGMERDEALLEYPPQSFPGYRLLTEYFAFPEKFLFLDIKGLGERARQGLGRKMQIFFFLKRLSRDLERNVSADTFRLGCTPIVNLYPQRAEPIRLTHTEPEYRIVPDARRPLAHEVYSVDRVTATSVKDERVEYAPMFAMQHAGVDRGSRAFWHAVRRSRGHHHGRFDEATEVYLTLVDLRFDPAIADDWTVDVQTTCLNRDLPGRLPFGGGQPRLRLTGGAPIDRIRCLTPPTRTRRPSLRHGTRWRLVSHLALNHLMLSGQGGIDGLRELLQLYDFTDSAETRSIIDGIADLKVDRIIRRVGGAAGGPCRGLQVTVQLDEGRFSGSNAYLFASILERFLAMYCSINSFTTLQATSTRREGVIGAWPPRAGETAVL